MHKLTRTIGGRCLLGGLVVTLLTVILFAALDNGPNFSPWSLAVDVGPPISTDLTWEGCPFISKNGLDLYHRRWTGSPPAGNRWDIFVSHRDSVDDPWGPPINLGPNINTSASELCSFVTIDGHWLYFISYRTDQGSFGGTDIFVSRRKDKRDPTGWETPKNLGPNVNSSWNETGPCIFGGEAKKDEAVLYFTRHFPEGQGGADIYASQMLDKETFGPAFPVVELNTSDNDFHAFVSRRDGLTVIFCSDHDYPDAIQPRCHDGYCWWDLYVSTRPTTSDPWGPPVNLGPLVNSIDDEVRPSLSWDGTTLYFWTNRSWITMDVYQATRTKVKD